MAHQPRQQGDGAEGVGQTVQGGPRISRVEGQESTQLETVEIPGSVGSFHWKTIIFFGFLELARETGMIIL